MKREKIIIACCALAAVCWGVLAFTTVGKEETATTVLCFAVCGVNVFNLILNLYIYVKKKKENKQ